MATPEQIFTDLQQRFKYDEQITKTNLDKKITSLQEFRFFCEDEKDVVGTFVTPIPGQVDQILDWMQPMAEDGLGRHRSCREGQGDHSR